MNPETGLMSAIEETLNLMPGVWVHRNQIDQRGRMMRGMGIGSADLIGICTVWPYGTMKGIGRFFAIEVKTEAGFQSDGQATWQKKVEAKGGFYAVVRSVAEAMAAVKRCREEARVS